MRRIAGVVAGAGVLLLAVGCTEPETDGIVGISVSAQGDPVAHIQVCVKDKAVEKVGVFRPGGKDANTPLGEWIAREKLGAGTHTVDLAAPGAGWRESVALPALRPGRTYNLDARLGKGTGVQHVPFTLEDLGALEPGEVFYRPGAEDGADKQGRKAVPLDEFRTAACDRLKS